MVIKSTTEVTTHRSKEYTRNPVISPLVSPFVLAQSTPDSIYTHNEGAKHRRSWPNSAAPCPTRGSPIFATDSGEQESVLQTPAPRALASRHPSLSVRHSLTKSSSYRLQKTDQCFEQGAAERVLIAGSSIEVV